MNAIIFDVETTGFAAPEVIEAAWQRLDTPVNLLVLEAREQRFKPSKPIELGAMAVHHVMDEDLAECAPSSEFRLPDSVECLIGHNVDFDWRVIGKPDVKRICTCALSRYFYPDTPHTLSAMLYYLHRAQAREWLKNAHSAADDVENCLRLLRCLLEQMGNPTSWDQVWAWSELARTPTKMPMGKHKGKPICELPADYKAWCLQNMTDLDPYLEQALRS